MKSWLLLTPRMMLSLAAPLPRSRMVWMPEELDRLLELNQPCTVKPEAGGSRS